MVARLTPSSRAVEDTVFARPGQQVAGMADLLGGQGRRPAQAHAAGAGGVQALPGALTISSRRNSASAAKTWKTSRPPGVVASRPRAGS